jgi:hypothetical protein
MDQFQIGERIWGTDRPFFLKVAHCLSKCRKTWQIRSTRLLPVIFRKNDEPFDGRKLIRGTSPTRNFAQSRKKGASWE